MKVIYLLVLFYFLTLFSSWTGMGLAEHVSDSDVSRAATLFLQRPISKKTGWLICFFAVLPSLIDNYFLHVLFKEL